MALLFLESCESPHNRWLIEGNILHSENEGLIQKKAFVLADGESKFTNKITHQFRETEEFYEQRKFRLSFWMKTNGNPKSDSEFISVVSKKEKQGGMIGLDKNGRFYVGYLCKEDEWQGKLVKSNLKQPSVTDGKVHFVEFDVVWDNLQTAHIIVYVDNKQYLQRLGVSVFDEQFCWSRPDTITFGNLIGCDLVIDDIIMWDDKGTEYVGPKGPKRILYSEPIGFEPTIVETKGQSLYETFIPSQSKTSLVTVVVSETAGSMSDVSLVFKNDEQEIQGPNFQVMSENDTVATLVIGAQEHAKSWIGIEKK